MSERKKEKETGRQADRQAGRQTDRQINKTTEMIMIVSSKKLVIKWTNQQTNNGQTD